MTRPELIIELARLENIEDVDYLISFLRHQRRTIELINGFLDHRSSIAKSELVDFAISLLESEQVEIDGPDMALISSWLLVHQMGLGEFKSNQVKRRVGDVRQFSNITTTMESLERRGWVQDISKGTGHKLFILTNEGELEASILLEKYERLSRFGARSLL